MAPTGIEAGMRVRLVIQIVTEYRQTCVVGGERKEQVFPWLCKLILGGLIQRFPKLFAVLSKFAFCT